MPSRTRKLAAIAGLLVGCIVAGLLVATGLLTRAPEAGPDTVPDLLEAYHRSRLSTFVVDAEFTRTMPDGRQLASAAVVAQRPPDRVQRQLGAATGRLGNQWLNCSTGPDGGFDCLPGGDVAPFDEEAASDVDALRTYVEGDRPAYSVTAAGAGCHELRREVGLADPHYGDYTRMCFDAATGAVNYLEIRRDGGSVDVLRAIRVRPQVTDADFAVREDGRFAAQMGSSG